MSERTTRPQSIGTKIGSAVGLVLVALALGLLPAMATAAPAANDNFASPQSVSGSPVQVNGDLTDSTMEAGEPAAAFGSIFSGTVWYSWTAPATGSVTLSADKTVGVGAYTGTAVNSLAVVNQNYAPVTFAATAGTTYRIAVAKISSGSVSTFTLTIELEGAPANDDFADAEIVTGNPVTASGSTQGATVEVGEPDHNSASLDSSVWYRWTAPTGGDMTLDVCDSTNVNAVAVYSGSPVDALTPVASDHCRLFFTAEAGTVYSFAVAAMTNFPASFDLTIRSRNTPANDDFADAETLTGDTASVSRTLRDSSLEVGEPAHHDQADRSVWFRWTAAETGPVSLTVPDDAGIVVYEGNDLESLSQVAGPAKNVTFGTEQGTTYRIAVIGYEYQLVDDFELTLQVIPVPDNDDFANAETLTGATVSVSGDTRGATSEPNEPTHHNGTGTQSVWYEWTAPQSTEIAIDACSPVSSVVGIAVYTGAALESLTPVAAERCEVIFSAESGTTYRIAVAGSLESAGEFRLRVRPFQPPANDDFADAEHISGSDITVSGELTGGTVEPTEPAQVAYPGYFNSTVWYRWVAPGAGTASLELPSDLGIGIYKGTSLASLSIVVHTLGSVNFPVTAGTVYWIAVGRIGSGTSGFTLNLNLPDTTPPDTFIDSGPTGAISATEATFAFHGTVGDTAKIQCRLDSGPFEYCTSPKTFTGLAEGAHTVRFRAEDAVGNVDQSPATQVFRVDRTAPSTTINSGPSGTTAAANATFTFGANETGTTFECRLDSGSFTACTSPKVFASVAAGSHTFETRSTDAAGNVGAAVSRSWTYSPESESITTGGSVPDGGTISTDPTGSGPTVSQPATAAVSVPQGGEVLVVQKPVDVEAPAGFSLVGQQFEITAPTQSVADPLVLGFRILGSALPAGYELEEVSVMRDGTPAADCADDSGKAVPDPCVAERELLDGGDIQLTVLSSHASDWNVIVAETTDPPPNPKCVKAKATLAGAKKMLAKSQARVKPATRKVTAARKELKKAKKSGKKVRIRKARKALSRAVQSEKKARATVTGAKQKVTAAKAAVRKNC